ncbi:uncharacterized protein BO87DRAFT_127571 [Aspergillus neoniger CBS 115656]|uniref:Uncharacterized protein n=1 Tax=Aspergillus neoniger (strain CBS 115656) TaxID=1448310 RepID=A0A318YUK8_ASPNB|nr:hypothetical protein BO87DRAFT_127571 [Aspergillus neoniger CBS 115656]PYH38515.1 hypothetical protein BO87DRAFT_127571 [Aspergillus neoniger CBS 115656]
MRIRPPTSLSRFGWAGPLVVLYRASRSESQRSISQSSRLQKFGLYMAKALILASTQRISRSVTLRFIGRTPTVSQPIS